jgi:hypothetical protein
MGQKARVVTGAEKWSFEDKSKNVTYCSSVPLVQWLGIPVIYSDKI